LLLIYEIFHQPTSFSPSYQLSYQIAFGTPPKSTEFGSNGLIQ